MKEKSLRSRLLITLLCMAMILALIPCVLGAAKVYAEPAYGGYGRICFNGDRDYDWAHIYNVDSKDDTLTFDELNITVLDKDGATIAPDKYELKIYHTYYDEKTNQDVEELVTSDFSIRQNFYDEGFSEYYVKVEAKEGSGGTDGSFFIADKHSLCFICADIDLENAVIHENWRMHERFQICNGTPIRFVIRHSGLEEILTQGTDYDVTYYRRSGTIADLNNPEIPFEEILVANDSTKVTENGGVPSTPGPYFARITAKAPYYGENDVLIDIADFESEPIKIDIPSGKTLTYSGKAQTGVEEGEGYILSGDVKETNVGSYKATATLKDGYEWSDGPAVPRTIEWKINKAEVKVNAPKGKNYTYNGKVKTVMVVGAEYILSGTTKATKVGTYTAKATLKTDANYTYKWSDGTTAPKTFKWKINKANNPLNIKAKIATVKYSKLKKKNQTLAVGKVITFTKKGQGNMTYTKASGNKKIAINKTTGKVTVKKGLKKGTYKVKVKVKAAGNANYKASAWKTVTFSVRIK